MKKIVVMVGILVIVPLQLNAEWLYRGSAQNIWYVFGTNDYAKAASWDLDTMFELVDGCRSGGAITAESDYNFYWYVVNGLKHYIKGYLYESFIIYRSDVTFLVSYHAYPETGRATWVVNWFNY